ncbi:YfhO family protein [Sediminibacterium ginsengisoli]|uniref:Membrane protein YfhO n=1 Tax=Sediminibacterium ginsengisoli TaxID=413434 RepID=A0A1T4LEA2_9BACT|nr:YfhO family protein [Sediminibacterium ginsengisoli]SJZ52888.1 membrane protein YfhO [Sediminibacterium ginsengisoli]
MKNFQWKSLLPHVIAVAVFVIVAVIYCKPALEGKVLAQTDVIHWKGMAQDMVNYQQTHDNKWPLWNNNLFSGMPGYQVAIGSDNALSPALFHQLFMLYLPKPIGYFFLLCIGFYFLSQVVRVNPWLGILGGLAYAYATYSPIIISVGHDTKMQAMGYLPALLGALWLIYQRKYWWGGALTALFTAMMIAMNHPQVAYYFVLMAVVMSVAFAIHWIRQKEYKHMLLAFAIAAVAAATGATTGLVNIATSADYAKATMRGGTANLDTTAANGAAVKKSDGLPIDYAFHYGSVGVAETYTFLVPGIYGGSSSNELTGSSHIAKAIMAKGAPEEQAAQIAASMPTYWGSQPGNAGPVYFGAVICFLFLLGMVYLKTWHRWWILATCIIAILMSWGSNFMSLNSFLFNHLPLYNKFRAPSIILVLPQLLFPLLGVMALQKFLFEETDKAAALAKLKKTVYVTAGFIIVAVLLYLSFDYTGKMDEQIKASFTQMLGGNQQEGNSLYSALREDRKSLFGADLVRSILLIAASVALLWLALKQKLKAIYVAIALLALSSFDLLAVGRRYLNDNNYQEAEAMNDNYFKATPIDAEINKDTTHARVFNLASQEGPFNDAITSYHHRSIGGYHPAKLSIYNDLIEYQLSRQPMNMQVLNMLNTRYFIFPNNQNGQPMLQINPDALGPVWFVKQVHFVNGPANAMKALNHFNAKDTAIVEEKYRKDISALPVADSTARIRLVKNDNDYIQYHYKAATNQFAVFSEVFYDRGWKATIDGKELPIVATNYVLRGLALPAGEHDIIFEFRPSSYYTSMKAAIGASVIVWLGLIGAVIASFAGKRKEQNA